MVPHRLRRHPATKRHGSLPLGPESGHERTGQGRVRHGIFHRGRDRRAGQSGRGETVVLAVGVAEFPQGEGTAGGFEEGRTEDGEESGEQEHGQQTAGGLYDHVKKDDDGGKVGMDR